MTNEVELETIRRNVWWTNEVELEILNTSKVHIILVKGVKEQDQHQPVHNHN